MSSLEGLAKLIAAWRSEAERFRALEATGQAATLELAARELEQEIERFDSEPLTLAEASEVSGYSVPHLRRMVRDGKLASVGRDGRGIRVLRHELPRKPGAGVAQAGGSPSISRTQVVRAVASGIDP